MLSEKKKKENKGEEKNGLAFNFIGKFLMFFPGSSGYNSF